MMLILLSHKVFYFMLRISRSVGVGVRPCQYLNRF